MIHRNISRRTVLQGALLGGGLATFGAGNLVRLAQAQDNPDVPDRYYVFCYFGGGWDVLLSLDPRDPRQFNNDNIGETRIQPGYELQGAGDRDIIEAGGLQFGPYIGDLVRHSSFGEGVVTDFVASAGDHEVTIQFRGEVGIKRLLLSFAPLEKIEG